MTGPCTGSLPSKLPARGDGLCRSTNGVAKEALSRLPRGSKPWPMQAGCSSPTRFMITCARSAARYLRGTGWAAGQEYCSASAGLPGSRYL
jgi:hypothetical protein